MNILFTGVLFLRRKKKRKKSRINDFQKELPISPLEKYNKRKYYLYFKQYVLYTYSNDIVAALCTNSISIFLNTCSNEFGGVLACFFFVLSRFDCLHFIGS